MGDYNDFSYEISVQVVISGAYHWHQECRSQLDWFVEERRVVSSCWRRINDESETVEEKRMVY
jgi:hypothetical protein